MNTNLHIPRIRHTKRQNPLWLTHLARRIGVMRGQIVEYRRLRRTGLHRRASFWCAWNLK